MLQPRPGESSMRNEVLQGLGHTELVTDPGVYGLVRGSLEEAATLWRERRAWVVPEQTPRER